MAFLITKPFHFNCQIVNKSLVQRCLKEPSFYICSTLRVRSIWLEFRNNLVQFYLIGCVFLTCESKVLHFMSADFISNFPGFLWLQSTQLSGRTIFEHSCHFYRHSNINIYKLKKLWNLSSGVCLNFWGRDLVVGAACYFILLVKFGHRGLTFRFRDVLKGIIFANSIYWT